MKSNYIENYGQADARQQNWEKDHGYRKHQPLTPKEEAKKQLEAELYSLQHEYLNADYNKLHKKLYHFGWVEEMDEIFEDLDLTVEEILNQEEKDE